MGKRTINFWSYCWSKYVIGVVDSDKKTVKSIDGETPLDDIKDYTEPQGNEGLKHKKYPKND